MRILVTGATGFIGETLVKHLSEQNHNVNALFRSEAKLFISANSNISFCKGDITDLPSLENAMKGCSHVYHLAAFAQVWSKNKDTFENINYKGTINVLETAIKLGVTKVVVTSTAGVFGPSENGSVVTEETKRFVDYFSEYERTKDMADNLIMSNYSNLIDVCIVCPTRVFGPGILSASNSVTKIIKLYKENKFRFLPGNGSSIGNYVFIDDVVNGITKAMELGNTGERYIIGGTNVSFKELFSIIRSVTGADKSLFKIPTRLMIFIAYSMQLFAKVFRIKPLITSGWARKYLYNWIVSSSKANKELEYNPQNLNIGIRKTVEWLECNSL